MLRLLYSMLNQAGLIGSMGPEEFGSLATLLLSTTYSCVRDCILDELWNYVMVLQLPFRYAVLIPLALADSSEFRSGVVCGSTPGFASPTV